MSGDWADERLNAAFAARAAAAGPVPAGLVSSAIQRIATVARRPRPRTGWNLGAAASLVAVVLLALVIGFNRSLNSVPASQPPSFSGGPGAPATSSALPSPTPSASPAVALETISVSDALRIRDSLDDGRELAVSGYLSPDPGVISCPLVLSSDINPALVYCPYGFIWLMEKPERTITQNTIAAPKGPAFHPSFGVVGFTGLPERRSTNDPMAVVLVGHFDDRRSSLCPADRYGGPTQCLNTFLVDQIRSVDGMDQPSSTFDRTNPADAIHPTTSTDQVDRLVAAASHGQAVLSLVLLQGAALWSVEPGLRGDARYIGARLVWLVTTLDTSGSIPTAQTWLTVDGSSTVARVTDINKVALVLPSSRPDQTIICGRLDLDRCAAAIELVRAEDSHGVDTAWKIVVDDSCPLRAACDRLYPFDAFVVLVTDPALGNVPTAFHVVGLGDDPEKATLWAGALPTVIQAELTRSTQSPGAS